MKMLVQAICVTMLMLSTASAQQFHDEGDAIEALLDAELYKAQAEQKQSDQETHEDDVEALISNNQAYYNAVYVPTVGANAQYQADITKSLDEVKATIPFSTEGNTCLARAVSHLGHAYDAYDMQDYDEAVDESRESYQDSWASSSAYDRADDLLTPPEVRMKDLRLVMEQEVAQQQMP